MNNRLSQRVYSEPALEFWLQRLGADWERQFSGQELSEGRRLYRNGSVRQVELGQTDAIVHMRMADNSEAYVVLDWEKPALLIRASVDEVGLRRILAVAGLYEVEELVGDEIPAIGPATAASTAAAQPEGSASDSDASDVATAATATAATATAAAATADAAEPTKAADKAAGDDNLSAPWAAKSPRTTDAGAASAGGSPSAKAGRPDAATPAHTLTAGGGAATAATEHATASTASGAEASGAADNAQGSTGAATGDNAEAATGRQLALHLSLRQGALMLQASWRQSGRRRATPALGQEAPSAESMSAAEREALIRLASLARRAGFRYDKAAGGYRMSDASQMERFASRELRDWAELFTVTQEADVLLLARGVQEVSLRARVDENETGNLSLKWMAGFDDPSATGSPQLTAAERRRLLRSGAEPLLLPGRGLVRLSQKQAQASERLNDAVSLFPGGAAPRYLLFSLIGLGDLPVEVSTSLQRWRQKVIGGMRLCTTAEKNSTAQGKNEQSESKQTPNKTPPDAPLDALTNASPDARADAPPDELPEFLRPYQRIGVSWMRHLFERGCHGLLADEMGLGKTVQVLSLIAGIVEAGKVEAGKGAGGEQQPSLVVCPASVVPVWQSQAAQFFPHLRVKVLGAGCTFVTEAAAGDVPDMWVASYTQLRRHKPLLEQVQFACAVLDEAQFIKNPEAKVTQACLSLKAERRLALSGTPLENRYLDVWTLFRFLMPGLLGSRRRFEENLNADEGKHLVALRRQLGPFILRRTKGEVASELPDKVELDLVCPLTDLQRGEYRRLLSEGQALYRNEGYAPQGGEAEGTDNLAADHSTSHTAADNPTSHTAVDNPAGDIAADTREGVPAGGAGAPASSRPAFTPDVSVVAEGEGAEAASAAGAEPTLMSVLTLLTRLRQVACDPALLPWMSADLHHSGKLNLLRDRLGEIFANGKKAVVFSQFVKFLDRAKQAIAADYPDVPIYELTGATRDRGSAVNKFQSQEGAGVILVSLRAGGTGITLHAADYVFLLDPWWNPAVEEQAIDRVHRIGQVNRVFVYRMVTAETVEVRIAALKQQKRERFERIISGASQDDDDFRQAFRSLESLLGLLKDSGVPQSVEPAGVA